MDLKTSLQAYCCSLVS